MAPNSKTCSQLIVLSRLLYYRRDINISSHTRHILARFEAFRSSEADFGAERRIYSVGGLHLANNTAMKAWGTSLDPLDTINPSGVRLLLPYSRMGL